MVIFLILGQSSTYVTATVTFSIEIELGWGLIQYDNLAALSRRRQAETQALDRLLTLCDELHIPFTFDVVGHLLLDEPLSSYNGGHETDWFKNIPKTGPAEDPEFYAPDLIDRIRSASVDHEIGTHTFTHVEPANISRDTLRWEFDRVLEIHKDHNLDRPVSIVPPRHSPPPRDLLREYGFDIIRAPRDRAPQVSEASNTFRLGWDILTGAQPICRPQLEDGVVETYCTRYPSLTAPFLPSGQQDPHSIFKTIPQEFRQKLHTRNLNITTSRAIERDSFTHLWAHLWDTANDIQWPQIRKFLHRIATFREAGNVQIRTMKELDDYMRGG